MANSPDLQMHDLICEPRDQLLRDVASRNSMLDRLNASNERLTAENAKLKLRLQRMCEPVSDEEWHNLWDAQMLCGMIGTEATTREGTDMIIAVRANKE